MNNLKEKVLALDLELEQVYAQYIEYHQALGKFKGKQLVELGDVETVNQILKDLQDTFADLFQVYNFILHRHQGALIAVNGYNDFITTLRNNASQGPDFERPARS